MSDRKVQISVTRDGGRTFGNIKERSLGELGDWTKRVRVNRMGEFRTCSIRVRVSSPIRATLMAAFADITPSQ